MSSIQIASRAVIAECLPGDLSRDIVLIVTGTLLTALAAQIVMPLPFTPVPISGQTFAVLLVGASLGPVRGVASMVLYICLGTVGLPFFADATSGTAVVFGATGGYLMGFVLAAWIVGLFARRGYDRRTWSTALSFVVGSGCIYAVGVPWLAIVMGISIGQALALGLVPFLVGDLIKAIVAGLLLPGTWRLLRSREP